MHPLGKFAGFTIREIHKILNKYLNYFRRKNPGFIRNSATIFSSALALCDSEFRLMRYRTTDIISLRAAAKRCRALAASSNDGLASLSYAQLAEEIDDMIAVREAATVTERTAKASRQGYVEFREGILT